MKISRRLNSVFYKLIASYIIVVLLTSMTVGITSYFYFSANFNTEVSKIMNQLLEYQRRITDEDVFVKTEKLYVNLVTNQYMNADLAYLFSFLQRKPFEDQQCSSVFAKLDPVQFRIC